MSKCPHDLHHLRNLYGLIYTWHKENGERRYREKFLENPNRNDKWFFRYVKFLGNLPRPSEADIEAIHASANEVLCGCMEWSYCEKADSDISMATVAKEILAAVEQIKFSHAEDTINEKLRSLKNLGQACIEPCTVEVEIRGGLDLQDVERYESLSLLAYSDLKNHLMDSTLGGYVTLADSNLEKELQQRRLIQPGGAIRFRNAAALRFKPANENGSIASLIADGTISVETLTIGKE